ncbi:hypothetical protein [Thiohalomonas denitrificans]|uniref:Phosphodiesterase n=1 Tax=Thiohalomonas denitrificans TaxID=415747 RepID=A0A1G5R194_9GAMM|nr:hypothetical protein [Thiohalomonas denitrificans]SCZ67716.1 hypothetical protein SAMN03097708_03186 [Thiohalomonas denitrificans]
MRLLSAATGLIFIGLFSLPATADTLTMPPKDRAPTERVEVEIEMPAKGMSMRQVEKRFGPPEQKAAPVGDPPITRWKYDDFTVYFEHQYVIHSVLNR